MAMATHIPAVLCRTRIPLIAAASVVTHHHTTLFLTSRAVVATRLDCAGFSVMGQRLQRRAFSCSRVSMALKSGIVGLPNVGKSTLFNALVLSTLSKSQKIVPTSVEFVDIAGLVKGASQGEGLGNKFLSDIREVDCILQVVRCFEDNDIVHVNGKVDPDVDIDIINLELAFADISQIEKRLERLKKGRAKDPQVKAKEEAEQAVLLRINEALLNGQPARMVPLDDEERKIVEQLCLITMKPVIFAANVAEAELADASGNPHVAKVRECAAALNAEVVDVSAQGLPMASQRGLLEKQRPCKRGMVSRAVAEPERDEVQTDNMLPLSRSNKGEAVSTTMMGAALTSVFPERKSIHETAIVHSNAFIGEGVVISAFCTVGPDVSIGNGTKLHPGSHICGNTEIGEGCEVMNGAVVGADISGRTVIGNHNTIGYHAVVGVKCQDMKYKDGDECYLHIGNNNDIREYVSIHRSAKPTDCTVIGDNNLIMGSCHIAHDCKLGNHNILANGTLIGGHVILEDHIHTGGAVAIHQHCHIDSYSFLAGGSMVTRDVPMYMMVSGDRAELRGLNLEGMRRLGFSNAEVKNIRRTYQKLFMNTDTEAGTLVDRLSDLEANEQLANVPAVVAMLHSVRNCFGEKRRGICAFRHWTSV